MSKTDEIITVVHLKMTRSKRGDLFPTKIFECDRKCTPLESAKIAEDFMHRIVEKEETEAPKQQ